MELPTGPVGGGTLFKIVKFKNDPDEYLCTGSCDHRGPLWVQLEGVEWEDITCPRCLFYLDEGKWPGVTGGA
jgi:hypothetical protein